MTDGAWRQSFDGFAPQYLNESFNVDGVRGVEFVQVAGVSVPPGSVIVEVL